MLNSGAVESVLEIDDEAILQEDRPEFRNQAYPNLGEVLLDHSDILVAVSDEVDGGPGGTLDVMRLATRRGIPVVKISTKKPEVCVMRPAPMDHPDQTPREGEEFIGGASELPRSLVDALGHLDPPVAESRNEQPQLEIYYREIFRPSYFGRVFKAVRDALTAQGERGRSLPIFRAFRA